MTARPSSSKLPPVVPHADAPLREPVEQLVELARSAREDPLPRVLEAVADAVIETCHFRTLAVNVYRPAWDDYEVVLVRGGADVERALLGTRFTAEELSKLVSAEHERLPGTFVLTAESAGWAYVAHSYVPDLPRRDYADAWQAEDGVIVALADTAGAPLGLLSVDEPASGRRPTDNELRFLRAICSHAEQALETARRQQEAATNDRLNTYMPAASAQISACETDAELWSVVGATIADQVGFERVAVYERDPVETFGLKVTHGWSDPAALIELFPASLLGTLIPTGQDEAGSWLIDGREFRPAGTEDTLSIRNGRGALGWSDHCLLVPVCDPAAHVTHLLVIEDPFDHRLPSRQQRSFLRLLADQTSTALAALRMREMQQRLLELVLVREGAPALAEALADTVHTRVALLDWTGQLIAAAPCDRDPISIPTLAVLQGGPRADDDARCGTIARPLEIGGHVEGYLLVENPLRPEPLHAMAVEQAANSFTLQLAMVANAEEVEHRMRGSLIDELLDSPLIDLEALSNRTRRLGGDLDSLRLAIAVRPVCDREPAQQSVFIYLARAVRSVLDDAGCLAIIAPRAESVLALITQSNTTTPSGLGERIVREARLRTGLDTVVGISRAIENPTGLAAAVREAQLALEAARTLPHQPNVTMAGELDLHRLLVTGPRRDEIERAARRLLDPLIGVTAPTGSTELIATLGVYLDSLGNLESTARQLGVHPNTVRYRISGIEGLLCRDLRDARTRIDLRLALDILGLA
jgi:sugar diacid utilization regulator/GAF domain-containing protein